MCNCNSYSLANLNNLKHPAKYFKGINLNSYFIERHKKYQNSINILSLLSLNEYETHFRDIFSLFEAVAYEYPENLEIIARLTPLAISNKEFSVKGLALSDDDLHHLNDDLFFLKYVERQCNPREAGIIDDTAYAIRIDLDNLRFSVNYELDLLHEKTRYFPEKSFMECIIDELRQGETTRIIRESLNRYNIKLISDICWEAYLRNDICFEENMIIPPWNGRYPARSSIF
jgi:hypothetical protein